ncbi:hypothetical protein RE9425_18170 [Prescottella equi]|nr:hypothetical protein RE9425_18170 [Prescottella equi]BDC71881.1 hypothetical protein KAREA_17960 [Prescottella equi]
MTTNSIKSEVYTTCVRSKAQPWKTAAALPNTIEAASSHRPSVASQAANHASVSQANRDAGRLTFVFERVVYAT